MDAGPGCTTTGVRMGSDKRLRFLSLVMRLWHPLFAPFNPAFNFGMDSGPHKALFPSGPPHVGT